MLFVFLNARAAVMVAITIPLTLLTVFGVGNLFGYTINRITLFALILSLGLLVGSATVVVENIVRNRREHPEWSKVRVINISVSEVGVGLFLSTFTTILGSLAIVGDPVWSGLAWSIAFGLSLSAVLTLIVFPTLVFHFFEHRQLLPGPDVC